MATGAGLQSKIKNVLQRVQASDKAVVYRTVAKVGGNSRLGLSTSSTITNETVTPTPSVERLSSDDILSSGGLFQHGDYRLTLSGDFEEAKLKSPNARFVYGDEVLQIQSYQPLGVFQGVVAGWVVIARTVKAV